ncbi:hypothetical protein [Paracoccus thiocyanatus]|uniref:Uncharacterized protein n=1 Tax=Paracoccus thiocyanatus TaxID=34006 RepID=A0A3D8PF07_9RHOB|nr:hypothetical protein [Paracoccus thiocyanatus]RDW14047.1 hypothetical protein DIE28_04690 [Paracoccus thiocyanatus]
MILALMLPGAAAGQDLPRPRSPVAVAAAFLPRVQATLDRLDVAAEALEIRANRCSSPGGDRDDIFYIWIGMRGTTAAPAGPQLRRLHAEWRAAGWTVTRMRQLRNGGVNLAAREPGTGNGYAFDSGFAAGPQHVAGFFDTPCFRNPDGPVRFGRLRPDLGDRQ